MNGFFGASGQSITELEVGGAGSQLPPSTLPSVAITGEAASPVHWNLIQEGITNREGIDPSLIAMLEDKPIPEIMQVAELGLDGLSDFFLSVSSILAPKWYNPGTWANGGISTLFLDASTEVGEAANWLATSENGWHEVIGAGGAVQSFEIVEIQLPANEQCITDQDCFSGGGPQESKRCLNGICLDMNNDPCTDIPTGGTTTIQKPVITFLPNIPNDGVVTVASQQLTGADRTDLVDNVTHFGEQSNREVWDRINSAFQETSGLNSVFEIQHCDF